MRLAEQCHPFDGAFEFAAISIKSLIAERGIVPCSSVAQKACRGGANHIRDGRLERVSKNLAKAKRKERRQTTNSAIENKSIPLASSPDVQHSASEQAMLPHVRLAASATNTFPAVVHAVYVLHFGAEKRQNDRKTRKMVPSHGRNATKQRRSNRKQILYFFMSCVERWRDRKVAGWPNGTSLRKMFLSISAGTSANVKKVSTRAFWRCTVKAQKFGF